MAKQTYAEYVTAQAPAVAGMRLDDIFKIEQANKRNAYLAAWIEGGELDAHQNTVSLRTSDGKALRCNCVGVNFAEGETKKLKRRAAVDLMERFGPKGSELMLDPTTAYDMMSWASYQATDPGRSAGLAAMQQHLGNWPDGKPQFALNHVIHVTEAELEAEREAAIEAEAQARIAAAEAEIEARVQAAIAEKTKTPKPAMTTA